MASDRRPDSRQLRALSSVAAAGGAVDAAPDEEACDQCLMAGWLAPHGAHGFRLTDEGRAELQGEEAPAEPAGAEGRAHPRRTVMRRGVVVHQPSGRTLGCTIVDLSLGGARVQLFAPDIPKRDLTLIDRELGVSYELRVVWAVGPMMGVQFVSTTELPNE